MTSRLHITSEHKRFIDVVSITGEGRVMLSVVDRELQVVLHMTGTLGVDAADDGN